MQKDENNRGKRSILFWQIADYAMGIIYLLLSAMFAFPEKFNLRLPFFEGNSFRYVFAGMIALYGIWRIYRGVQRGKQD